MNGKIRALRLERGLTMRGLADKAGVAKSTIYVAESGRHTPRIQSLRKIADALGVKAADLLEDS